MTTHRKTKRNSKKGNDRPMEDHGCVPQTTIEAVWNGCQAATNAKRQGMRLSKRLGAAKRATTLESSLGWLVNSDVHLHSIQTIDRWHRSLWKQVKRKRIAEEIVRTVEQMPDGAVDSDQALIVLAAAQSIRAIAARCPSGDWHALVSRLLEISRSAATDSELSPCVGQQLAIELPLTIAFQFPELEDHEDLATRLAQRMAVSVSEMLDHDGWPHAAHLRSFGPLVASWVRCKVIIAEIGLDRGLESDSQLEWLVRQLLRMLRPDGTLVFANSISAPVTRPFLDRLLELTNDPDDKRLAKYATTLFEASKNASAKLGIEPSNISEWSESALLQSRWEHGSPKVAVDFSRHEIWTEVCQQSNLIRGATAPEVSINGVPLHSKEPFEVTCVQCDDDVDYLEVVKDLGQGVSLTRQYLLSRSEEFLLVADLVIPSSDARIDYRGIWRLAPGVNGMHESETREVYLLNGETIQSLVLPLALPEWKAGATDDKLDFQDGSLCLAQSVDGAGLYAPLFFDLSPQRSKEKRTWRQLTVAENLRTLRCDEACAFRIQLDKQQWLLYRSVASVGNRTYMGENVISEFAFSRFTKHGTSKQLIAIQ